MIPSERLRGSPVWCAGDYFRLARMLERVRLGEAGVTGVRWAALRDRVADPGGGRRDLWPDDQSQGKVIA
jgi:hypothetical protein